VRPNEEIGVQSGQRADDPAPHEALQAAGAGEVAAILNDGVYFSGRARSDDELFGVRQSVGERLFAEHMAAVPERRQCDRPARFWYDDVKNDIWPEAFDKGRSVRIDNRVKIEFAGARQRPLAIEIRHPDDLEAVDFRGGAEPSRAHCATTDDDRPQIAQAESSAVLDAFF
jgi:hypothetical protein